MSAEASIQVSACANAIDALSVSGIIATDALHLPMPEWLDQSACSGIFLSPVLH
jgi:hypothetical protein